MIKWVVMINIQPRCKAFERQRCFTKAFTVTRGADNDAVAPILAAIVVGIIKINPHNVRWVEGGPQNGDRVPANKACCAIGDRNARWLGMNQRLVAIVVGVIAGIEVAYKIIHIA